MKFILFAEGYTEKLLPPFFKRWLDPRLRKPVGFHFVRFRGWGDFTAKVAERVPIYLAGEKAKDVVAVIGLIDLYGPDFVLRKAQQPMEERYRLAVKHVSELVCHPKFRMYFAVHEIEAWILSQPHVLPRGVAKKIPRGKPESINFHEPPSKLLNRLYHADAGKGYRKLTYGKHLFRKLDPSIAATKCPHLDALLNDMLSMAKAAGL